LTASHDRQAGTGRQGRFHGRVQGADRRCTAPGCDQPGEFRAPPDPDAGRGNGFDGPGDYRWFCLDHVRAFNQSYNFFAGMSTDEIYAAQRPAAGWERESRAFARAGGGAPPRWADFADPLDAIGARFQDTLAERAAARAQAAQTTGLDPADRKALATLGLGADATRRSIREAYSRLVRAYHPDRNGGDRRHEKALQAVIAAYTHLRKAPAFA